MHLGLLPFGLLVALGVVALVIGAIRRAAAVRRVTGRVPARHAVAVMAPCLALWLGLCVVLGVVASLGHSTHPWRDAWPQCAVGLAVLVVAPAVALAWIAIRPPRNG